MHHHRRRRPPRHPTPFVIQPLEARQLLAADPVVTPALTVVAAASPAATVTGFSPTQIKAAYGLAGLTAGSTALTGAGQTIAIVDAYNDPNIAADLATFDSQFGLATASLSVVGQTGSTTALPGTDADWAQEISLDVEWAHAIAPGAKLLLVEASSDSTSDLTTAIGYARGVGGVSAVSMSWGTSEFSGETSYDGDFTTPTGHTGVTFVAAAGDDGSGGGAEWPSAAAGVVSVGGTSLTVNGDGTYSAETGWADSGGGASAYEGQASFQYSVQRTGYRQTPDVAWDANPNTGVAVYDSLADNGASGWQEFGGTSAGAPQWAGVVALADQGRTLAGLGTLDGATDTLPTLYGLYAHSSAYATDFHDVTSGSSSHAISAAADYDEVTGIGSPQGAALVAALEKTTVSLTLKQTAISVSPSPTPTRPPGRPGVQYGGVGRAVGVAPTALAQAVDPVWAAASSTAADLTANTVATTATSGTGGIGSTARALMQASPAVVIPATLPSAVPAVADFVDARTADVAPPTADLRWTAAVPADGVAAVPPAVATAIVPAVPTSAVPAVPTPATTSHAIGVAGIVVAAGAVLVVASEPARTRRRHQGDGDGDDGPLLQRWFIRPGLLRG